jgi:hypothetical protein
MAGIRKKGDAYYCTFRFQGKRYYFTVGDISEAQALAKGTEVDETLNLIERGRLTVPDGVPLEEFVAAGGKAPVVVERSETFTARSLFDRYLTTLGNGTIEEKSLVTLRSHLKQVCETIGARFRIQGLTLADLQGHVDRRAKKGLSPVTSKKEIASFRACWNWAVHGGLLKGAFPNRGLRFAPPTTYGPVPRAAGRIAPREPQRQQGCQCEVGRRTGSLNQSLGVAVRVPSNPILPQLLRVQVDTIGGSDLGPSPDDEFRRTRSRTSAGCLARANGPMSNTAGIAGDGAREEFESSRSVYDCQADTGTDHLAGLRTLKTRQGKKTRDTSLSIFRHVSANAGPVNAQCLKCGCHAEVAEVPIPQEVPAKRP